MSQEVSFRELGKQMQLSGEAIRKAVKDGRIPASCVGEKILSSGRARPIITDPEGAIAHMRGNTDQTWQRDNKKIGAAVSQVKRADRAERTQAATPPPADDKSPGAPDFQKARAVRESYMARLARLEFEERSGKLVDAQTAKGAWVKAISTARTKLLGMPSKMKSRCPHLTLDDLAAMEDVVREVLEELADGG